MAKLGYLHISKKYNSDAPPPTWQDRNLWAALELAKAGFYVFPCLSEDGPRGKAKRPAAATSWKETSTCDIGKLNHIFSVIFKSGIPGIHLENAGLVVIDPDQHAGAPDGIKNWYALIEGREMPDNIPIVKTPNGEHWYFKQPQDGAPLGNSEGALKGLGINVRGAGGYVIGAGACLPDGKSYGFEGNLSRLMDAPEIPSWLVEMLRGKKEEEAPHAPRQAPDTVLIDAYYASAFHQEIEDLRSAPKGGRNNQLNDTAFNIAQMVHKGAVSQVQAEQAILAACDACGLLSDKKDGMAQCRATMRSAFNAARAKPKKEPNIKGRAGNTQNASATKPEETKEATLSNTPKLHPALAHIYNAVELMHMKFDPIKYLCDGLMIEGCTILGAKPKFGKSWLAFDLARGVSTGTEVMGRKCVQGNVLYCALEDNARRLQSRFDKLSEVDEADARLQLVNTWPTGDEAITAFHAWRETVENPKLIIVDTLKKIKKAPKGKQGDNYSDDYDSIALLQKFYLETGISILLITHTRKSEAEDVYDTITGTLGQTGAVDNIMVMRRDKSGASILDGKGRDMDEYSHTIKFDKDTFKWTIGGSVDALIMSGTKKRILAFMRGLVTAVTPSQVAKETGSKTTTVKSAMSEMVTEGLIIKAEYGKYLLPFDPDEQLAV